MSKLRDEARLLLNYPQSTRDSEILLGLIHWGSIKKLVKETDFRTRTVQRRLAAMREDAQKYGLHESFDEASTVLDQPIRGKSRLRKFDPPLPDGTVLQWDKTKVEDAALCDAIKQICEGFSIPPVPKEKFEYRKKDTENNLAMLVVADAHLGLLARDGWGLRENLDVCKDLIVRHVDRMQPVEHALLNNVGDLTHTDGLAAQTPKGKNLLDVNALYHDIYFAGAELIIFAIEALRTKAKQVTYMGVPGNHDKITAFHITEKLKERYRDEPRVHILNSDRESIPFIWENNFIVGWHGDSAPNSRAYEWITTEYPKECGNAEHIHVAKGHIHHTRKEYIGRACFETFATSTRADAYHDFRMYQARRGMKMVYFEPDGADMDGLILRPRKDQ